jgi:hypothetical protein
LKRNAAQLMDHPNLIIDTLREVCQEQDLDFRSRPEERVRGLDWEGIQCTFSDRETFVAHFELQQMPGCCAVLIIHHVRTNPFDRVTVDRALQLIEKAADHAGFGSLLMAQCVPHKGSWRDEPWVSCLKRGWKAGKPFINAKSGNSVVYLTKDMEQKGKRAGLEFEVHL